MRYSRLWLATSIIAFVVIVSFVFSVPRTRDVNVEQTKQDEINVQPLVTIRDSYKKNTHTITGFVDVPNACASVSATSALKETTDSKEILIEISISNNAEICLQLPTQIKFQTTLVAPAQIPITAIINGVIATTTAS